MSERIVTVTAMSAFALLSIVLWLDYLSQSGKAYDERDSAKQQIQEINAKLLVAADEEEFLQLSADQAREEFVYQTARSRITAIDGWSSLEWKLKNSVRFAAPPAAALFAAFTLLSIFQPLSPRRA